MSVYDAKVISENKAEKDRITVELQELTTKTTERLRNAQEAGKAFTDEQIETHEHEMRYIEALNEKAKVLDVVTSNMEKYKPEEKQNSSDKMFASYLTGKMDNTKDFADHLSEKTGQVDAAAEALGVKVAGKGLKLQATLTTDNTGKGLLPTDTFNRIMKDLKLSGAVAKLANHYETPNVDIVNVPRMDDTGQTGLIVYSQADALTTQDPSDVGSAIFRAYT